MRYIHDSIIKKVLISSKGKICSRYNLHKDKYPNITNYLLNRFEYVDSIKESIFRIKYNILERPICKECGNKTKYVKWNKYTEFCSKSCSNKYHNSHYDNKKKLEIANKKRKTLLSNTKKNLIRINKIKEEYHNRTKEKKLERNKKISDWQKSHPNEMRTSYNKMANTIKNKSYKEKREKIEKEINTKRKNNTFNKSKSEEEAYHFLNKNASNIIRQYNKDKRYPWACDFYIPDLDLFIECNFHWTHGKHPYDSTSQEDISILNEWNSKNTKYYINAIQTWTIRDVNKRNKAKENNINFIEFWSLEELIKYFTDNYNYK